jgi:hypothetical protein
MTDHWSVPPHFAASAVSILNINIVPRAVPLQMSAQGPFIRQYYHSNVSHSRHRRNTHSLCLTMPTAHSLNNLAYCMNPGFKAQRISPSLPALPFQFPSPTLPLRPSKNTLSKKTGPWHTQCIGARTAIWVLFILRLPTTPHHPYKKNPHAQQ